MCDFFSGLGMPDGDVRWHDAIDSHSDLVSYFEMSDLDDDAKFAKLELTPGDDPLDINTWAFQLDEDARPSWVTNDLLVRWEARMRSIVSRQTITTGTIEIIADGFWILGGDAKVNKMIAGRVLGLRGKATITDVRGGTITDVWGSASITDVWGGTISNVSGSASITDVRGGTISNVSGSASIRNVWGGTITDVSGSASIRNVWGGTITDVRGSASIRNVSGLALLDESAKRHVVTKG